MVGIALAAGCTAVGFGILFHEVKLHGVGWSSWTLSLDEFYDALAGGIGAAIGVLAVQYYKSAVR